MKIDDFAEQVRSVGLRISISSKPDANRAPATADALFHLPLLSLAILALASQKGFTTAVVGNWVGALMAEQFHALRWTSGGFHSSMTLRRRSADALAYLESLNFVDVSKDELRKISLSDLGKRKVRIILAAESDGGLLFRQLVTNRQRVISRGTLRDYSP